MRPIRRGMGVEIRRRKFPMSSDKNMKQTNDSDKRLVNLIRLSDFINNVVATRKIPFNSASSKENFKAPTVIMKLDIEGSEVDVVSDLLFSGSLRYLDVAMIEWHQDIMEDANFRRRAIMLSHIVTAISQYDQLRGSVRPDKRHFEALKFDDETYYSSNFELPKCSKDTDAS